MKQSNIDLAKRDKRAAVIGVAVYAAIMLLTAAALAAVCFVPDAPVWVMILMGVLAGASVLAILPSLAVLKHRFAEIEKGELYEASEY